MLFIWYPKCTTCQKAKAWLDTHGLSYELREIKTQNPTEAELRTWHSLSGLPLRRTDRRSSFADRYLLLEYKSLEKVICKMHNFFAPRL